MLGKAPGKAGEGTQEGHEKSDKKSLEQESLEKDEDVEMEKVEVEDSLEKGVPKNGKNGPRKDSLASAQNLEKERQLKEQLKKALEKASTEEAAAGGTSSSSSSRPAGPMQSMPLIGQLEQALEKAKDVGDMLTWRDLRPDKSKMVRREIKKEEDPNQEKKGANQEKYQDDNQEKYQDRIKKKYQEKTMILKCQKKSISQSIKILILINMRCSG